MTSNNLRVYLGTFHRSVLKSSVIYSCLLKCIAPVRQPILKIQLEKFFLVYTLRFLFKMLFKDFVFRSLFILFTFSFTCLILSALFVLSFILTVWFACYCNFKFGKSKEVDCMMFSKENLIVNFSCHVETVNRHNI